MSAVLAGREAGEPARAAVLREGRAALGWDGLEDVTRRLAEDLRKAGAGRAARIGILLPDGPDMAICCVAAMESGVCVPLNPGYRPAELTEIFALTGLTHLVTQALPAALQPAVAAQEIEVLELTGTGWELSLSGGLTRGPAPEEAPPSDGDLALLLLTSGSTARPKLVPLTHGNLVSSIGNLVRSLALGPGDRCLNMMPMFHVGGLIDLFLAPLAAGGSVVCAPAISSEAFFAALGRDRPTWFQGVPTVLRDLLAHAEATGVDVKQTGLRLLRSVSAPIPPALLQRLEAAFGIPVIEIYGMTETAGLIASNPLPPGVRKPGSVGIAAGPEVRIVDETGNAAPAGRSGEVVVRGPTVTAGYLNAELRREDFFIGPWLRTGDEGSLDAEGYLTITGRIKEIINRGGEKISPRQIDELTVELPGIKEAAAYATPHPTLGEEVALAVVLEPGATVTREEIIAHLGARLAQFKVPRTITFLAALPRVPSGKLDRKAIPDSVEQARSVAEAVAFEAPATPTEKLLARLFQKTLGVARAGRGDNFFELGGDSLTATTFVIDLEAAIGRSVPPAILFEAPTLAELAARLDAQGGAPAVADATLPRPIFDAVRRKVSGWHGTRLRPDALIVGRNTLGSQQPLFWGTQAEHEFVALAGALGADRPLYTMSSMWQLEQRNAENSRLLGRYYAQEIDELQPKGRIHLGGFCEGGTMAFHTATALLERGRELSALMLQDRFVPMPFAAPVSFFWAQTIWLNALDVERAAHGWAKFYPDVRTVQTFPFLHDRSYVDGYVQTFAGALGQELARLEDGGSTPRPAGTTSQPVALDGVDVAISARVPPLLRRGKTLRVPVRMTNRGTGALELDAASGVVLSARWLNFDRYPRVPVEGATPVTHSLAPGDSASTELELRVPDTGLPLVLRIDLLEEGIGWFAGRGSRPFRTVVLPIR